jgi:hypothetical protein
MEEIVHGDRNFYRADRTKVEQRMNGLKFTSGIYSNGYCVDTTE